MRFQKILFGVVVLIGLSFSFSVFAAEIPVGTLLYRTSPGGLMFGQNTNWLISPFGISWLNCGHVGMYIGDNQVVEAAEGKIQIIPLNHFVNLKIGEKFVGARIPKDFDRALGDKLKFIAEGQENESYDSIFHQQKGQNSGEWTCVGFTEKIYESLKADYPSDLIYDSSKYYIDLVSDGPDVPENYSNTSCFAITKDQLVSPQKWEDGSPNCFSKTKEFSFLNEASVSLLASKIIGVQDDKNRGPYIFFPYTQFLSDKLKDVPIDPSEVSSYFDRPSDDGFINAIKNTITNLALRTTGAILKTEDRTRDAFIAMGNSLSNFFADIFNNKNKEFYLASVYDSVDSQSNQNQDENILDGGNLGDQILGLDVNNNEESNFISTSTEDQSEEDKNKIEKDSAPIITCSYNFSQSPSHQGIIINEVAWMGTTNNSNDEWIELKNISNQEIDLSDWQIIDKGEQIKINLASLSENNVRPGGFVLLERTDDDTVSSVKADLIYSGGLSNSNEGLRLFDSNCNLIDEVLASPDWPAGDNSSKYTMERNSSGFNWYTSSIIGGTPKKENSLPLVSPIVNNTNNNPIVPESSATTNTVQSAKILINEIQTSPTEERFIELYNPNNFSVNLSNYYIQRKTKTGSSFSSLVSKTYFENKIIPSHGYFLISRSSVEGGDVVLSNLTLTESNTIQIKYPDGEVADKVGWGEASDCESSCAIEPQISQSIQRKVQDNVFIDTDNNANDFEIRNSPSPKNSSNVSGPIAVQNFDVAFNSDKMELNFSWASSTDVLVYKILDISSSTETISTPLIMEQTTSTQAIASIKEIGRNYQFSITPFDQDGFSASSTIKEIQVPSFLSNLYFYSDQYGLATTTLAEFNFNSYPFIPEVSSYDASANWKAMVLYFDKDLNESNVALQLKMSQYNSYIPNRENLVYLDYYNCCMDFNTCKGITFMYDSTSPEALSGSGYMYPLWPTYINIEDGHLVLPVKVFSDGEFSPSAKNYLTIAFYDSTLDRANGAYPYFNLIAVDKTRYHFQNESPLNVPPTIPTNLTATSTDGSNYILNWVDSTDPDTLDSNISYEYNFSLTGQEPIGEWQSAVKSLITPVVNLSGPGDWTIYLRAKDDTGLYSGLAITTINIGSEISGGELNSSSLFISTTENFSSNTTEEVVSSTQTQ